MDTTTDTTAREAETVAKYAADLVSGTVFHRHANSHNSVFGYQPPMGSHQWAAAMKVIANMAAEGDALAQVAVSIQINLYGTPAQAAASIYRAAAQAVAAGYDDVLGRTGPEAGRHSAYQRTFSLREVVIMAIYLHAAGIAAQADSGRIGWVLARLAEQEGVNVDAIQTRAAR